MAITTTTVLIAALVAAVAGAGVSAYGQAQSGKAQQALNNYNASVTEQAGQYNAAAAEQTAAYNASLSRMEARAASVEGGTQAGVIRTQNRRIEATQRARMAASGVTVGAGSPLVVEVAQAGFLEMRALEAQRQAGNRAGALGQAAEMEVARAKSAAAYDIWSSRSQAALDRMGGSAARTAGQYNAAATVLQGAGRAASSYYGMS